MSAESKLHGVFPAAFAVLTVFGAVLSLAAQPVAHGAVRLAGNLSAGNPSDTATNAPTLSATETPRNTRSRVIGATAAAASADDAAAAAVLRALEADLRRAKEQTSTVAPAATVEHTVEHTGERTPPATPPAAATASSPKPPAIETLVRNLSAPPVSPVAAADELSNIAKGNGRLRKVRPGTRVLAPGDGLVVYAGPFRDYGRVVILRLLDGTRYVVLAGRYNLRTAPGKQVTAGRALGVFPVDDAAPADLYTELRTRRAPPETTARDFAPAPARNSNS